MNARFVRLSIIAASAAATALLAGAPAVHAAEGDAQFLAGLADLGITFATPEAAIAAGNNVCDIVSEGSANSIAPAEIRSAIVNAMVGEGLTENSAIQLMATAVAAYCPDFDVLLGA